ncbi:MAG: hypothetical protein IT370_28140 [Deltaproteobacteria bacterium]|nr:hypothetical protein [Deltaproteobacteria bacterium]
MTRTAVVLTMAVALLGGCKRKPAAAPTGQSPSASATPGATPASAPDAGGAGMSSASDDCEAITQHQLELEYPDPVERADHKRAAAGEDLRRCRNSAPAYLACSKAAADLDALEACDTTHARAQCERAVIHAFMLGLEPTLALRSEAEGRARMMCPTLAGEPLIECLLGADTLPQLDACKALAPTE